MEPAELTVRIAQRVADREGTDVTALEPPLHDVINGDALAQLISSHPHERTDFTGCVSFTYLEYSIIVDHTGEITVIPATSADEQTILSDNERASEQPVVTTNPPRSAEAPSS